MTNQKTLTNDLALADEWRETFPYEEADSIVAFVQSTWKMLVERNAKDIQPKEKEPTMTKFLRSVLDKTKRDHGFTGKFCAEDEEDEIDWERGTRKNVGRTDIKYFSDRLGIDITFEFKKLKKQPDSRKSYYGIRGMERFICGKYSRNKHLGFMVGIIVDNDNKDKVVQGLKNAICKPDIAASLHLIKDNEGKYIIQPSKELPNTVEFDTEHARTLIDGSPDIILCHFYLTY